MNKITIDTMKQVIQLLGPTAPECSGCAHERNAALNILEKAIASEEAQTVEPVITDECGRPMTYWGGKTNHAPPPQAERVPMTPDDIYQLAQRGAVNDGLTAIVREVEAHHRIGGAG